MIIPRAWSFQEISWRSHSFKYYFFQGKLLMGIVCEQCRENRDSFNSSQGENDSNRRLSNLVQNPFPFPSSNLQGVITPPSFPNIIQQENIIFYLELSYVILTIYSHLKALYCRRNIILCIEINDDILTREYLILNKKDKTNKINPILPKGKEKYIYSQILSLKNRDNNDKNVIKLSFQLCNFSNDKLTTISDINLFLPLNILKQYKKHQCDKDVFSNQSFMNHKIGNISFQFQFCIGLGDKLSNYDKLFRLCKLKEIYNDNVGYNEREKDYYGYNLSQQLSFENIKNELQLIVKAHYKKKLTDNFFSKLQKNIQNVKESVNNFNISNFSYLNICIVIFIYNFLIENLEKEDEIIEYINHKKLIFSIFEAISLCNEEIVDDLCFSYFNNENFILSYSYITMKIMIDQKRDKSLLNDQNYIMFLNKIINNFESNCLIITNIITILNFSMDDIELKNLFKIISVDKLNNIFLSFKKKHFFILHESIINYIKQLFTKFSKESDKSLFDKFIPQESQEIIIQILTECVIILNFSQKDNYLNKIYIINTLVISLFNKNNLLLGKIKKQSLFEKLIDILTIKENIKNYVIYLKILTQIQKFFFQEKKNFDNFLEILKKIKEINKILQIILSPKLEEKSSEDLYLYYEKYKKSFENLQKNDNI